MTSSNILYFIISLLFSLIFGSMLFFFILMIVSFLFPAVTSDGLHPVMPIGQMLISLLLTIIASVFFLIFSFKKLKRKYK